MRGLIERVVLTPAPEEANGLRVELSGDLATILAMAEGGVGLRPVRSGGVTGTSVRLGQLSVVAGTGFEPVTFRL